MKFSDMEKMGYRILKKEFVRRDSLGRIERWTVKRPDGMVVSCNVVVAEAGENTEAAND